MYERQTNLHWLGSFTADVWRGGAAGWLWRLLAIPSRHDSLHNHAHAVDHDASCGYERDLDCHGFTFDGDGNSDVFERHNLARHRDAEFGYGNALNHVFDRRNGVNYGHLWRIGHLCLQHLEPRNFDRQFVVEPHIHHNYARYLLRHTHDQLQHYVDGHGFTVRSHGSSYFLPGHKLAGNRVIELRHCNTVYYILNGRNLFADGCLRRFVHLRRQHVERGEHYL